MKKNTIFFPLLLIGIILTFFYPYFLFGKLPIPTDTIVGLYHPYRDLYATDYPRGVPFKNALITDPVRQQYPWRLLSIEIIKEFSFPLWNPYSMAGIPLAANFQSAAYYPLNIFFFLLPFSSGWTLTIILQPLLMGILMYAYVRNLGLRAVASLLSGLVFAFSGFSVSWLTWNTLGHVTLWLPLALLCIDKLFFIYFRQKIKVSSYRKIMLYLFIFLFSLVSAFLAGHLQLFFYFFVTVIFYFFLRWYQYGKRKVTLLFIIVPLTLFVLITIMQWLPTLQLISHSARDVDLIWQKEGWFIPWQHLIQFIAPDFFGNPATLNYWGTWNYGEFVGYIGIFPLMMAAYALAFFYNRKTLFFGTILFASLFFALETPFSVLPFSLHFPFLASAQPTRLLFLTDFSLAVLAGLGLDDILRKKKNTRYIVAGFSTVFLVLLVTTYFYAKTFFGISEENISIAKRNLVLPIAFFLLSSLLLLSLIKLPQRLKHTAVLGLFIITMFDLYRFAMKFTPFSSQTYLYPNTKTIDFIKNRIGFYRMLTADTRILPPNFSLIHKIATVDGYDPLYLRRYGEYIASSERGNPDISPPFGFNRIIHPQRFDSKFIDLLGVKYILSLNDISNQKFNKVFQEGETRVYENTEVIDRTFFVPSIYFYPDNDYKNEIIKTVFERNFDFREKALVEDVALKEKRSEQNLSVGKSRITFYSPNKVVVETNNNEEGFLILTDTYYPTWRVTLNELNKEKKNYLGETKLYRANYNFRGVYVPKGKIEVTFLNSLFFK